MHPNQVVRGPERFHARSRENPPPQKLREPRDWPLLVPVVAVIIGLAAVVIYVSSQWSHISGPFQ